MMGETTEDRDSTVLRWKFARWVLKHDSPLLRHVPFLALFALVGGYISLSSAHEFRDVPVYLVSIGVVVLSVVVAAVMSARRMGNAEIVPLLAVVAIALSRVGATSVMSTLLVLCMVWFGLSEHVRWVIIGTIGAAIAVLTPYVWPTESRHELTVEGVGQLLLMPLVCAAVAGIVHFVVAGNRQRSDANARLVVEREAALAEEVAAVDRLRDNEARLTSATNLFSSVLDSVTRQSVIGTDLSGLIDVWNRGAEGMLGADADEVVGERFIHEFHVQDELDARSAELGYPAGATVLNPGFSALVEVARLGGSEGRDWTYVRADGGTLPVHVAVTPRIDADGHTVGYIFVGTDITDNRELARLQDQFVGLVSHELRTPISSILGYIELLRESDDPLTDEQRQFLSVAERNAHRLLRLVGDLLFTAQVAADKFPIEPVETDLAALVSASVESARPVAERGNVLLLLKAPEEPITVVADPTRIAQACDNLLSNAIKFTPPGGTVSVGVRVFDGTVEVSVSDTGIGIPADEMARLSTRFFRASTATRAAVQGVGLGLSITKAIVTSHGGQLSAESEVGSGTTFRFSLPLLQRR